MKTLLMAGTASLLLLGGANAHAALMTITPGTGGLTFGSVPRVGTSEALPVLFGLPASGDGHGWYGAIITGEAATYTYDVFGAEANFRNRFRAEGDTIYTHAGGDNLDDSIRATFTGSSLDFRFVTNTTNINNGPSVSITNDLSANGNPNNGTSSGPDFFASFDLTVSSAQNNPLTGDVLWLFLDDGNRSDDDYDDLVVRITASAVPIPAAAWFIAPAIGLLAPWVKRRKATA
jgi:hypothetical protein